MNLTYTNEMQSMDYMYEYNMSKDEKQEETRERMEKLHKIIVDESKSKGFNGVVITTNFTDGSGVISEIYKSKKDYEKGNLIYDCCYCWHLIQKLEVILNNE